MIAIVVDLVISLRNRLRWMLDDYCIRRLNRGKILPSFAAIEPRRRSLTMTPQSPHWKTAPSIDPGERAAQFVECDRCGYRYEDISLRDRRCQRIADPKSVQLGTPLRRCEGTLRGRVTAGW